MEEKRSRWPHACSSYANNRCHDYGSQENLASVSKSIYSCNDQHYFRVILDQTQDIETGSKISTSDEDLDQHNQTFMEEGKMVASINPMFAKGKTMQDTISSSISRPFLQRLC